MSTPKKKNRVIMVRIPKRNPIHFPSIRRAVFKEFEKASWIKTAVIALCLATVAGLTVYFLTKAHYEEYIEKNNASFTSYSNDASDQLKAFMEAFCRDSDNSEGENEIFTKGDLVYYDTGGSEFTVDDECTDDGLSVNELSCKYDEDGSAAPHFNTIACPKGCFDGACVR